METIIKPIYKVGNEYSFSFTLTTVDEASFIEYIDEQELSLRDFQDMTTKPVIVIHKATYEDAAAEVISLFKNGQKQRPKGQHT